MASSIIVATTGSFSLPSGTASRPPGPTRKRHRWVVLAALALVVLAWTTTTHLMVLHSHHQDRWQKTVAKFYLALEFVAAFILQRRHRHQPGQLRGLQVIGAGFARTGTKSIETALILMGHRIYDLRSMFENRNHTLRWVQAAHDWKVQGNLSTIQELLEEMEAQGYTATLDFPMNMFTLALAELRPQAKVLFSVRDDEKKWVESWAAVTFLLGSLVCRPWSWLVGDFDFPLIMMRYLEDFDWKKAYYPQHISRPLPWFEMPRQHPDMHDAAGRQKWIDLHQRFQKRLETTLPAERLLIYNVKQGWEPLIPFFQLHPAHHTFVHQPFPHCNDRRSLEMVRVVMDLIAVLLPVWVLGALYLVMRFARYLVAGGIPPVRGIVASLLGYHTFQRKVKVR